MRRRSTRRGPGERLQKCILVVQPEGLHARWAPAALLPTRLARGCTFVPGTGKRSRGGHPRPRRTASAARRIGRLPRLGIVASWPVSCEARAGTLADSRIAVVNASRPTRERGEFAFALAILGRRRCVLSRMTSCAEAAGEPVHGFRDQGPITRVARRMRPAIKTVGLESLSCACESRLAGRCAGDAHRRRSRSERRHRRLIGWAQMPELSRTIGQGAGARLGLFRHASRPTRQGWATPVSPARLGGGDRFLASRPEPIPAFFGCGRTRQAAPGTVLINVARDR